MGVTVHGHSVRRRTLSVQSESSRCNNPCPAAERPAEEPQQDAVKGMVSHCEASLRAEWPETVPGTG
eukprot:3000707-Alexandrium_andersonii.AAC.1